MHLLLIHLLVSTLARPSLIPQGKSYLLRRAIRIPHCKVEGGICSHFLFSLNIQALYPGLYFIEIFLVYFIDYAITVAPFLSFLYPPLPCMPPTLSIPSPLTSCPRAVYVSSLASPFPILFFFSVIFYMLKNVITLFPLLFSPHIPLFPQQTVVVHAHESFFLHSFCVP